MISALLILVFVNVSKKLVCCEEAPVFPDLPQLIPLDSPFRRLTAVLSDILQKTPQKELFTATLHSAFHQRHAK